MVVTPPRSGDGKYALSSAKFDRRIVIERDGAAGHDGYQNVAGAPFDLATVFAQYLPGIGWERFASNENAATAPAVFVIRYSSAVADVNPKDRVRFGGRVYDLQRVEEIGRRVGLRLFGVARADG